MQVVQKTRVTFSIAVFGTCRRLVYFSMSQDSKRQSLYFFFIGPTIEVGNQNKLLHVRMNKETTGRWWIRKQAQELLATGLLDAYGFLVVCCFIA